MDYMMNQIVYQAILEVDQVVIFHQLFLLLAHERLILSSKSITIDLVYFSCSFNKQYYMNFDKSKVEQLDSKQFLRQFLLVINLINQKIHKIYCMSEQNTGEEVQVESLITEQQIESSPKTSKPLLKRVFGRMEQGSMRGAMFALMASALGTGLFNLPSRLEQVGLIPFILYVSSAGIFSYIGMYMITMVKLKIDADSYGQMALKTYGSYMKRISQFCLIIYPWGITICFQVIFAKFILQLLADLFGVNVYEDRDKDIVTDLGFWLRLGINTGGICLNMLFILKKEAGLLQKIGLVGVAAVTFNFFTILITSMTGFEKQLPNQVLRYHGIFKIGSYGEDVKIKWFADQNLEDLSYHFQALASIVFCYVNHQMVFPLSKNLSRPTKQRLFKIFMRANVAEGTIYTLIGIVGYLLLLEHVDQYEIQPMVMTNITTVTMSIGKCLMVISLFFAVPLNLFPVRQTLYEAFPIEKNNKTHLIISISLALTSCIVALSFQKVNSYFGLLGGTTGVLMAGGLPALFYFKVVQLTKKDYFMLALCLIVSIGGFVGAILSVVDPS